MEMKIVLGKGLPTMPDQKPEIEGKTPTDAPSNEWKEKASECIKNAIKILESEAQTSVLTAVEHLENALKELEVENDDSNDVDEMEKADNNYMDKIME